MKHFIQFTLGYLGYFIIGFMALRAMLIQDDKGGFVVLSVGLLLLISYVAFLEKSHEKPKYSGYIKLILAAAFLISVFTMLY
jgi:peptidoglycan/LPS O-acetylase OafA/YrhL